MMEFQLKKVLTALLFSTSESLSDKDVQAVLARYHEQRSDHVMGEDSETGEPGKIDQEVMGAVLAQVPSLITSAQIRVAMREIAAEQEENCSVFRLVEGPNGYRFSIHPDYADWVRLLRNEPRPQRLSPAALETLAVIAYRQPVTRAEIEAIRGVSADSALNRLMERELVCVVGRAELPGRPLEYGTTDAFLEFCGIASLEELPASDVLSPNEISEWIRRATIPQRGIRDGDMGLPDDDAGEGTSIPIQSAAVSNRDREAGDQAFPTNDRQ